MTQTAVSSFQGAKSRRRRAPGPNEIIMDPEQKSPRATEFEHRLSSLIIGQERAVRKMSGVFQLCLAGMNNPERPIASLLFLGPTGSGKTRVVEAASEVLFGEPNAIVKIDCAEYQHSHEIAKLIGSPPGFLGHRTTSPILTQENLDRAHTADTKITFVLFDEIEKANDSLWQLLLGVLDKATLTLGDNRKVNFSKSVVIMTSNLGAREMHELLSGGIGFKNSKGNGLAGLDRKIYTTAVEAARRRFSPEFVNRIDKMVVFRSLRAHHIQQILEIELTAIQNRITESAGTKFIFHCTDNAKAYLLRESSKLEYGARDLKRTLERFVVYPMANLVATQQIETGDFLLIDFSKETGRFTFRKDAGKMIINSAVVNIEPAIAQDPDEVRTIPTGANNFPGFPPNVIPDVPPNTGGH